MAIANAAPVLIKTMDQPENKFGKVLKSSVRKVTEQTIAMRVATGTRAKFKRIPEKLTREIQLPRENVWIGPLGTEEGLKRTETISVVLTNLDDIFPTVIKEIKQSKAEARHFQELMNRYKNENEKKAEEINTLKNENKELIDKITDMAAKK